MSKEEPSKEKDSFEFSERPSKKTSSSYKKQPIHLFDSQRQKRQHQRQERRMMLTVLVSLLVIVGLFYVLNRLVGDEPENVARVSEGGDPTAVTSVDLNAAAEASSDQAPAGAADSGVSQQEESSQAEESLDVEIEGDAMPNANTGDVVQDAKGAGKNHNSAASVYAYPIERVKEAMFDGEDLPAGKMAFLTFDDGVNGDSTPLLLDTLQEIGVPATFFMVGQSFTEDNKPILERTLQEGHALAFHSYDHEYEELYPGRDGDADEIFAQYEKSRDALQELLGSEIDVKAFRYPGGHMSWNSLEEADERLAEADVHWMDWNCMTSDAEPDPPSTTEGMVQEVLDTWAAYGNPNTITILMHDGTSKSLTRESLSAIVEALREEGFSFGILE